MTKRPVTFSYIVFYILFLPDAWQAAMGLGAAFFLTPLITPPQAGAVKIIVLFIMIATIGYAGTRALAGSITRRLKRWILGDKIF